MLKIPYPTVKAVVWDARDVDSINPGSDLGNFDSIANARKAIEEYRKGNQLIAWQILDIIDDEILQYGD